jgi:tRNA pseudouridine13 synthase
MIDPNILPPMIILRPGVQPASGGGLLKTEPVDFQVEEIPAYAPEGAGDFHYLWVEKEDVAGPKLAKEIARRLGIDNGVVGIAGMKDRRAVTRQWVSVPVVEGLDLAAIDGPVGDAGRITVLDASRHTNKLRTGHLKGNRFTIRLRDRDANTDTATAERLAHFEHVGFANAFGPQRFGNGNSLRVGLDALSGRRVRDRRQLRLGVSAIQSWIFNTWLADRMSANLINVALEGDLLRKRESGGVFWCDEPAVDTARIQSGELVLTGPISGLKARRARGEAAALEEQALDAAGLELESFRAVKRLAPGTRRDALTFPSDCAVTREDDGLVLRFTLPSGCYATVLLELICGPLKAWSYAENTA